MKIVKEQTELAKKIEAALKKDPHCPCRLEKTPDTLCMCKEFREQEEGLCHCGLYRKVSPRESFDEEIAKKVGEVSPLVASLIREETQRQSENIELIASENFPSEAVRAAEASCFIAKYAEGYPELERHSGRSGRYYGGCQVVDKLEEYCCEKWREVFQTDYHVNVQPHSGTNANFAAYLAVLKPGDIILAMSLENGSHLSHISPVNLSGKIYQRVEYGVDGSGLINYEELREKIKEFHPRLVLAGASAYPRIIDFELISKIIKEESTEDYHPYFMVDMAHIAGLIAAHIHPSPFGCADIITTTTQKTLRGNRGGLIFCRPELAKKVDGAVFPGTQGGPHMHSIAAKAVTAEEAIQPAFFAYIGNVIYNTRKMAEEFKEMGYKVITGGTDNHLFLIDLTENFPNLSGREVQNELDKYHITLNKNCIPGDKRSPMQASGLRIGCAAMTTKGWQTKDFIRVAHQIDEIIQKLNERKNLQN